MIRILVWGMVCGLLAKVRNWQHLWLSLIAEVTPSAVTKTSLKMEITMTLDAINPLSIHHCWYICILEHHGGLFCALRQNSLWIPVGFFRLGFSFKDKSGLKKYNEASSGKRQKYVRFSFFLKKDQLLVVDLPSVGVCTLLQWLISGFNYVFWLHLAQLTLGVSMRNTVGHISFSSFWKEMNYQRNSGLWVLRRRLDKAGPWGFHWVITWRLQDFCGLCWAFLSSDSKSAHKAWVSIPAVSLMDVKPAPSLLHPCCALVVGPWFTLSPLSFPTGLGELMTAHYFPSLRNLCTLLTTI